MSKLTTHRIINAIGKEALINNFERVLHGGFVLGNYTESSIRNRTSKIRSLIREDRLGEVTSIILSSRIDDMLKDKWETLYNKYKNASPVGWE